MPSGHLLLRILDDSGVSFVKTDLSTDQALRFGSGPDNDLIIDGMDVGAEHFIIGLDGAGVWIENTGGEATLLDGEEVGGRVPAPKKFLVEAGTAAVNVEVQLHSQAHVAPESLLGLVVGGYRIEQILAQGTVGIVYRAIQVNLGREVALKVLRPQTDKEAHRRFLRMIEISGRLNHPNVARVYDSGFDKARKLHYIVMERVDGRTLKDELAERGKLESEQAIDLLMQITSALKYLHDQGIIHRNVCPANLLWLPNQQVKLIGFGLVTRIEDDLADSSIVGHAEYDQSYYLAPELLSDNGAGARADIYAAGGVAYRALTGIFPKLADSAMEHLDKLSAGERIPRLREVAPRMPEQLADIVDRCLEPNPDDRYPSSAALKSDLRGLINPEGMDEKMLVRMRNHLSAMLPDSPDLNGFDTAVMFRPAEHGVGGDFYDIFPMNDGNYGVCVGDVTGHGIETLAVVGMSKMAVRILARRAKGPRAALMLAHRELVGDLVANTFVSAILMQISPKEKLLRYARAGQNPPILFNPARKKAVYLLNAPGMALGMIKGRPLKVEQRKIKLIPGDLLFIMTDGIVEAADIDGDEYGMQRLIAFLRKHYDKPAEQLVLRLAGELEQFTHRDRPDYQGQEDDRTALVLKLL